MIYFPFTIGLRECFTPNSIPREELKCWFKTLASCLLLLALLVLSQSHFLFHFYKKINKSQQEWTVKHQVRTASILFPFACFFSWFTVILDKRLFQSSAYKEATATLLHLASLVAHVHIRQQSTCCSGPVWQKVCKQNSKSALCCLVRLRWSSWFIRMNEWKICFTVRT